MNSKQANRIPLTKILEAEGFKLLDTHSGGHELRYENPIRKERTASFFVNPVKNVWKDFGGEGGTVIDLVMEYQQTDVRGALQWLKKFSGHVEPEKNRGASAGFKTENRPRYELLSTRLITDKGLIYYLHTRGISAKLGRKYMVQATYRDTGTGKEFYGLAVKNDLGGYSIRNKYFKTAIAPQGFTSIRGRNPVMYGVQNYHVFEGILDFLTVLESEGIEQSAQNVIILNSVNNAKSAATQLRKLHKPEDMKLMLWFDNEEQGSKASEAVEKAIGFFTDTGARCLDARQTYAGYKDANELWVQTDKQRFEISYSPMNGQGGALQHTEDSPEP